MPLVCAARSGGVAEVDVVRPDNMQAAQIATEFLIKRGTGRLPIWAGAATR
ncbi:DNA-binding transcriptional repressor MalI [Serratia rubidaea]|uniref:DNA-binding transcriptional repressor MalI n=1 Tax=Serratia rubidaea TaxID=61652 RepID=A0A447QV80_SERRU|nr:DNA-binding transcriptional repressor MalI [Serratia rubidaea]